jgi:hypothetical protein
MEKFVAKTALVLVCILGLLSLSKWFLMDVGDYWKWLHNWWTQL